MLDLFGFLVFIPQYFNFLSFFPSNEEYFPDLETMPPVIESQNASDILKTLFQNYDKRLRPRHAGTLTVLLIVENWTIFGY